MLNFIWAGFFVAAFAAAVWRSLWLGDTAVWSSLANAVFDSAGSAFRLSLGLTGVLCLWLGLLKIAETAGLTALLARLMRPLFRRIFPSVPDNHPALGAMLMNIAANMLGLDNAATPMGLKAMEELQKLNPTRQTASAAQQLFMVINASAVTVIPITILMYRAELGATDPAAVFVPILLATSVSTLVGFLSMAWVQKLPIFHPVVWAYLLGFAVVVGGLGWYFAALPPAARVGAVSACGNFVLFAVMVGFIIAGLCRRIDVYGCFTDGAKEGFSVAVKIIPYLVAMLTAIAALRVSGLLDLAVEGIAAAAAEFGLNTDFAAALPTALLKPLSGSGARAMMIETMQTYGADSFQGFAAAVVQGSTETTFYVLAVYFGAVGIIKAGAALPCALLADFVGMIAALWLSYIFY